jgi:hypothetical protein
MWHIDPLLDKDRETCNDTTAIARQQLHKYATVLECLIQQQDDQTNTKDNIPPIEEATERKPYGLRIF